MSTPFIHRTSDFKLNTTIKIYRKFNVDLNLRKGQIHEY